LAAEENRTYKQLPQLEKNRLALEYVSMNEKLKPKVHVDANGRKEMEKQ